jgi:guanylate kinase
MKTRDDGTSGAIVVISGPSGSGKSTIVSRLKALPGVFYSVSVTSRPPRPGELDGRDYTFVSRDKFERMIPAGAFAEHAEVAGNLYGTPRDPLLAALAGGRTAVVDIDVQGAMQIKESFPAATLVFIEPPSMDVLHQRLRSRGTESKESLKRRLVLAAREMAYAPRYDYRIVNDDLEQAVAEVKGIITRD